jgi:hypothetical protein
MTFVQSELPSKGPKMGMRTRGRIRRQKPQDLKQLLEQANETVVWKNSGGGGLSHVLRGL